MATWIIEDWAGNRIGTDEFDSFGEAREAIYELADIEARNNYPDDIDGPEYMELHNGICDDLYAIPVDENGNEVKDADYTI